MPDPSIVRRGDGAKLFPEQAVGEDQEREGLHHKTSVYDRILIFRAPVLAPIDAMSSDTKAGKKNLKETITETRELTKVGPLWRVAHNK